ncbi:MAG: PorV/PorQ family protein [Elusimicrobia bacterium]|nr:PorV/PorQ family protein [Elusimicrobiota bacterium]
MKPDNHRPDKLNGLIYFLSRPWFLLLALIFIFTPTIKITDALESGAEFLKIDTDARAVSMGSAYTAAAAGVNAISYNPAGLASTKGVELAFSHTNWLMDSKHDFIGIGMPIKVDSRQNTVDSLWIVGLGLTRLTNGSIESRNADRSVSGNFSSYDQSVGVALAKTIGRSHVGMGVKYIESSVAGEKARAMAVDLGITRGLANLPVSVGLSVQNLGTPMKYINQKDPLPLTFSAGMLFSIVPGLNMAFDLKRLVYDRQTNVSFGTEYSFIPGFALRSGCMMNNNTIGSKNIGFSVGTGINFWNTQIDYSVTPFGELGDAQRITLKKKF